MPAIVIVTQKKCHKWARDTWLTTPAASLDPHPGCPRLLTELETTSAGTLEAIRHVVKPRPRAGARSLEAIALPAVGFIEPHVASGTIAR